MQFAVPLLVALAATSQAAAVTAAASSDEATPTTPPTASEVSSVAAAHTERTWWAHSNASNDATEDPSFEAAQGNVLAAAVVNNGKRGLAYNDGNLLRFWSQSSNSKVSWAYNWASAPGSPWNSALRYSPMLWSNSADLTGPWKQNVQNAISKYRTDAILGFNEPDLCPRGNSACMTVAESVSAWKTHIQPFAGKVRLGAPAVTNGGAPMGLTWLKQFLSQCNGCRIDFVPVHWYASAYSIDYFKSYMAQAHAAAGGRHLWITEFGMDKTYPEADVEKFLKQALDFIHNTDYIEKAAWFGDFKGNLVNSAGTGLSARGKIYNTY